MDLSLVKALTWWCCFTNEGNEVFFDCVKGIKVVHNKHVSVGRFTADLLQLSEVDIGNTDGKYTVTWGEHEEENDTHTTASKDQLELICKVIKLIIK